MNARTLVFGAAAALTLAIGAGSAYAFSETEIVRFHDACRAGHRESCAIRDRAIHDHEHETEWRRIHPDWYR